jgi:multidrug efflux system membrane fusion protein
MKPPSALEPPHEERRTEALAGNNEPGLYPDLDLDRSGPTKNYWWVWLIVFSLIAYGCYELYQSENARKTQMSAKKGMKGPRNVPVVAATARTGDMPVYLQGLGTVTPFQSVTVKPRVDGQLISVNFREGQEVQKGDLLAQLDPRPFQVMLDQAKGNLAQAKGTLAKDQAALRDAQANYVRDQELFKQQIIAQQQLDTQLAAADQIRGTIEADNAGIEAAQAAINSAQLNLVYTRVIAPIGGRIGLRAVDSGNLVHSTDAAGLAVIAQLKPIAVLFSIPEDQLPSVLTKLSQGSKLHADAYDRDQSKKLDEGTLLTVDNQIDPTTGTSKLKAVFPNDSHTLFPNQFVNVRLALDTKKNAVIVPVVAIQRGPSGTFVYLVGPDNKVTVRAVKLGLTQDTDVAIDEGLQAGDVVVVDGAEKLTDGMAVTVRQPGQQGGGNAGGAHRSGKKGGKKGASE